MFGGGDGGSGGGSRGCGISFGSDMSATDLECQLPCRLVINSRLATNLWIGWADNVHICCLELMGLFLAWRTRFPDTGYLNSGPGR